MITKFIIFLNMVDYKISQYGEVDTTNQIKKVLEKKISIP